MSPYRASQVLELPLPWTEEAVKKAYRKRAKALHPDRPSGDRAAFEVAAQARAVLDKYLEQQRNPNPPSEFYTAAAASTLDKGEKKSASETIDEMWAELPQIRQREGSMAARLVVAMYLIRALWRGVRFLWPVLKPLSQVGFRLALLYLIVRFFFF